MMKTDRKKENSAFQIKKLRGSMEELEERNER
jgi:hypothetical protein